MKRLLKSSSNPSTSKENLLKKEIDYYSEEFQHKTMMNFLSLSSLQALGEILRNLEDKIKKEQKEDMDSKKHENKIAYNAYLKKLKP